MAKAGSRRYMLSAWLLLALLLCGGVPVVQAQQTEALPSVPSETAQKVAEVVSSIQFSYAFQFYFQDRDTGSGPNGTDNTTDIFF